MALVAAAVTFVVVVKVLAGESPPRKDLLGGAAIAGVGLGAVRVLGTSVVSGSVRHNPVLASFAVIVVLLLWINLVTALLGTALILEPHEPGLMKRRPRHPGSTIFDRLLALRTILVSIAVGAAAFGCFEWAQSQGLSDEASRTVALNTIVVVEVGYLFACRSLRLPVWQIGLFSNPSVWLGGRCCRDRDGPP